MFGADTKIDTPLRVAEVGSNRRYRFGDSTIR